MKNCKGFIAGMLTMLLLVCLIGSASATRGVVQKEIEYRDIKVSLDGKVLDLKDAKGNAVEPFMFGGTNYIPARALAEALGLSIAWDGANSTIVLTTPGSGQAEPTVSAPAVATPAPVAPAAPAQTPPASVSVSTPNPSPSENRTVYVTKTGKRYHYSSTCNGGTYYASTLSEARSRGLTPCDKCVG